MVLVSNKNILLIAPQYPPAINGLGDYAARLGQGLTDAGYTVHYAGLSQPTPVSVHPYWPLQANGTHLLQIVQQQQIHTVILNYSGYGYQRRGVPLWLVTALTEVKRAGIRIIIFFHELYANGPLWTSAFWLHPLQKKIFRQLLALANHAFTSNSVWYHILLKERQLPVAHIQNIGIFSNIPEPTQFVPWQNRKSILVIFGGSGLRAHTYAAIEQNNLLDKIEVEAIWDIGPPLPNSVWDKLTVPVKAWGILPAEEVSHLLSQVRYGALCYRDDLLGKSGIMAAYTAHAVCVWNGTTFNDATGEGLQTNQHYITAGTYNYRNENEIAQNGYNWYQPRCFKVHVSHWERVLAENEKHFC
jgi:hypothetical protein